jgi:hypothetical protein
MNRSRIAAARASRSRGTVPVTKPAAAPAPKAHRKPRTPKPAPVAKETAR